MGTPGSVDIEKGTVVGAYNLNWTTVQPVKEQIESALGIPFALDNDANVAALGERWKGAGKTIRRDFYYFRNRCRRRHCCSGRIAPRCCWLRW